MNPEAKILGKFFFEIDKIRFLAKNEKEMQDVAHPWIEAGFTVGESVDWAFVNCWDLSLARELRQHNVTPALAKDRCNEIAQNGLHISWWGSYQIMDAACRKELFSCERKFLVTGDRPCHRHKLW